MKAAWILQRKGSEDISVGLEKDHKALAPQPGTFYPIWCALPVNLVPVIWCYCEIALLIRKAVVQTHLFLGCGILFLTKTLRLPTLVFLKEKVLTTWLLGNNPSPIEFSRTHLQKGLYRCSRMQWAPGCSEHQDRRLKHLERLKEGRRTAARHVSAS